jgi:hypothetical protein
MRRTLREEHALMELVKAIEISKADRRHTDRLGREDSISSPCQIAEHNNHRNVDGRVGSRLTNASSSNGVRTMLLIDCWTRFFSRTRVAQCGIQPSWPGASKAIGRRGLFGRFWLPWRWYPSVHVAAVIASADAFETCSTFASVQVTLNAFSEHLSSTYKGNRISRARFGPGAAA